MKTAFLFPGQGSQTVGMGQALYHSFPQAKAVFEEIDDALNYSLSALIFQGPLDKLTLTVHTQPALMAVSLAAFYVLRDQFKKDYDIVAGHSLGEYSALVAAEVMPLATAAKLLHHRGQAMQEAVPMGQGAMAAIIGLSIEKITEIVSIIDHCTVANDNGAGQVVISGYTKTVNEAMDHCLKQGARKTILLPVSAPFHCPLMARAAQKMLEVLETVELKSPKKSIIMNVTADFCNDPEQIRHLLVQQVTATVRWRETIEKMANQGIEQFIEVGAGKVLTGISKRMVPEAKHYSVGTPEDFNFLD